MKLLLPSGEGWDEGENIKCSVRCAHDSKANCGSPHRGQVSFFARAKKETKESTPRSARPHPPFLAPPGARQLAGRKLRASGSNTWLAFPDFGCDARARHTGI